MKNVNVTSAVIKAGTEATAIEIFRSLRRSTDRTGGGVPAGLVPLISIISVLVKVSLCLIFTLVLKHFVPDLPENTEITSVVVLPPFFFSWGKTTRVLFFPRFFSNTSFQYPMFFTPFSGENSPGVVFPPGKNSTRVVLPPNFSLTLSFSIPRISHLFRGKNSTGVVFPPVKNNTRVAFHPILQNI